MMKKSMLLALLLSLNLTAADKASFGLNINKDDLEVEGRTSLAFATNDPVYRYFYIDGNFINANDPLFGLGFYVENSPTNFQNISFSIGLRGVFSDYTSKEKNIGDNQFAAIPIMVGAKARMYLGDLPESNLGVKFAYAPSPLTFQDAETYLEYRIEADMTVIDNVNIYIGYRKIETDYDKINFTYNDSGYIGFKFVLE